MSLSFSVTLINKARIFLSFFHSTQSTTSAYRASSGYAGGGITLLHRHAGKTHGIQTRGKSSVARPARLAEISTKMVRLPTAITEFFSLNVENAPLFIPKSRRGCFLFASVNFFCFRPRFAWRPPFWHHLTKQRNVIGCLV